MKKSEEMKALLVAIDLLVACHRIEKDYMPAFRFADSHAYIIYIHLLPVIHPLNPTRWTAEFFFARSSPVCTTRNNFMYIHKFRRLCVLVSVYAFRYITLNQVLKNEYYIAAF